VTIVILIVLIVIVAGLFIAVRRRRA